MCKICDHIKPSELIKVFEGKRSVSFTKDIAPVLLKEFYGEELTNETCLKCEELIMHTLHLLRSNREEFICVPKFSGGNDSDMIVVDIVYERCGI